MEMGVAMETVRFSLLPTLGITQQNLHTVRIKPEIYKGIVLMILTTFPLLQLG